MQKIITFSVLLIVAALSSVAPVAAQQYTLDPQMQYITPGSGACDTSQSYWRDDESMSDQYGSYNDPYAYGSLTPAYTGAPATDYVDYGTYSNDSMYETGYDYGGSGNSVDQIAAANLAAAVGNRGRTQQTNAQIYTGGNRAVVGSGTGGTNGASTTTAARPVRPSCTLIPRATGANSVVLEWQTIGATSAFIDSGVGHVVLGTGSRMVTPRVTTTYNMTVVDGRGIANQCAAIVHVNGAPGVVTNGTMVGSTVGQGAMTGGEVPTNTVVPGSMVDNGSEATTVGAEATKIGSNVSEKVTSVLSSGEGIWNKMRQMSLVAIGLFLVIFIIIFVMRKMFGGGADEGHH